MDSRSSDHGRDRGQLAPAGEALRLVKAEDAVIGWRVWTLTEGHLVSISGTVWKRREPMRAVCRPTSGIVVPATSSAGANLGADPFGGRARLHDASPEPGCTCGIYACDAPDDRVWDETRVVGAVRLWGQVIHADGCYRAEFAYPAALWVPRSAARMLVRRRWVRMLESYGVTVDVAASLSEIRGRPVTRREAGSATETVHEPALLSAVLKRSTCAHSPMHGVEHWKRVASNGVRIARDTPGANARVVAAFGILHDSLRRSDRHDPDHGLRASLLARRLRDEGILGLDDTSMDLLCHALEHHDRGTTSSDPTVGCAWDADRLELSRVGIAPIESLLSTEAARKIIAGCRPPPVLSGRCPHLPPTA